MLLFGGDRIQQETRNSGLPAVNAGTRTAGGAPVTRSSKMHDPPAWTKPGARWVAWTCWPMLGLCLAWMVWRIVEGDTGQALYPAFMGTVFGGLLTSNRANRRRKASHP